MSEWLDLSPLQKTKLHYGAMMLVAKEAKERGILKFHQDEDFCPKQAIFTIEVGDGGSGTVTLWPDKKCSDLVHVTVEFAGIHIQGNLYWNIGIPRPWPPYRVLSSKVIPDDIVKLALNPMPLRELLRA